MKSTKSSSTSSRAFFNVLEEGGTRF